MASPQELPHGLMPVATAGSPLLPVPAPQLSLKAASASGHSPLRGPSSQLHRAPPPKLGGKHPFLGGLAAAYLPGPETLL